MGAGAAGAAESAVGLVLAEGREVVDGDGAGIEQAASLALAAGSPRPALARARGAAESDPAVVVAARPADREAAEPTLASLAADRLVGVDGRAGEAQLRPQGVE